MRILIVGLNFWPEPTGVGKYTGEMAAYLSAAGHRVTVITTPLYYPYWKVQPGYRWWQYRTETWNGVSVIRCPLYVPNRVSGVRRLIHLLSFALFALPVVLYQKTRHPHVVFAIAPALFAGPVAASGSIRNHWRNWLHIQDFELDAALELGLLKRFPWLEKMARRWESRVYRRFGTLSTISHAMQKRLTDKGVEQQKIRYFPNWVNPGEIHPLEGVNRYRAELHLTNSDVVVLYSGSIGQKQGIETLIEAAGRLSAHPRIHFVICGEGPGKQNLQRSAEAFPNIHFLPVQPPGSLNELLNMADIHALPQKAGAADLVMPSKLLGMLASGQVVVATCSAGSELHEIVKQVGLVVPPGDAAALADKIIALAADETLRSELGKKGRDYAVFNFSSERVLATLNENLMALVNQKTID